MFLILHFVSCAASIVLVLSSGYAADFGEIKISIGLIGPMPYHSSLLLNLTSKLQGRSLDICYNSSELTIISCAAWSLKWLQISHTKALPNPKLGTDRLLRTVLLKMLEGSVKAEHTEVRTACQVVNLSWYCTVTFKLFGERLSMHSDS